MSRTETARRSAQEQAEPHQERARSTAEAQAQLIDRLDRMALDLSTITQRFDGSLAETEQTLEAATVRAEKILSEGLKSIRSATQKASILPQQVERFRIASLALAAGTGALASMLFLIALLIWQPPLIQALWKMAHALR